MFGKCRYYAKGQAEYRSVLLQYEKENKND
uniref:Uncharacterized protein n=1 Tax=Dulem virus 35 TaxID=3145753 RepID=A0AAU8B0J0_9CAUD